MGIVSVSVSGSPRCRYIALDPYRACRRFLASALLPLLLAALASAARADFAPGDLPGKVRDPGGIRVHDGSGIHNVGNLNLRVTNWGCFGSYPDGNQAVSHLISAHWPANSGVEYLYHDGSGGSGTLAWDPVSGNGQDITSGVYLYAVEPEGGFEWTTGKFVVIR